MSNVEAVTASAAEGSMFGKLTATFSLIGGLAFIGLSFYGNHVLQQVYDGTVDYYVALMAQPADATLYPYQSDSLFPGGYLGTYAPPVFGVIGTMLALFGWNRLRAD